MPKLISDIVVTDRRCSAHGQELYEELFRGDHKSTPSDAAADSCTVALTRLSGRPGEAPAYVRVISSFPGTAEFTALYLFFRQATVSWTESCDMQSVECCQLSKLGLSGARLKPPFTINCDWLPNLIRLTIRTMLRQISTQNATQCFSDQLAACHCSPSNPKTYRHELCRDVVI